MCFLAKINNKEFWAFSLDSGEIELRDDHFLSSPLPSMKSVLVKDELDPADKWVEMPPATLARMARDRMKEALSGLKSMSEV